MGACVHTAQGYHKAGARVPTVRLGPRLHNPPATHTSGHNPPVREVGTGRDPIPVPVRLAEKVPLLLASIHREHLEAMVRRSDDNLLALLCQCAAQERVDTPHWQRRAMAGRKLLEGGGGG